MDRSEILDTAKRYVCEDREAQYGAPEDNFGRIAAMWAAYKGMAFTGQDVAAMMCLLKLGRISSGADKDDNWIDLAGYAACGGALGGKAENSA